jgi:hypothetical protein
MAAAATASAASPAAASAAAASAAAAPKVSPAPAPAAAKPTAAAAAVAGPAGGSSGGEQAVSTADSVVMIVSRDGMRVSVETKIAFRCGAIKRKWKSHGTAHPLLPSSHPPRPGPCNPLPRPYAWA